MISKVLVYPRIAIEKMVSSMSCYSEIKGRWALISIYESKDFLDFKEMEALKKIGCESMQSFRFADVTGKENIENIMAVYHTKDVDDILLSREKAKEMVNFIDNVKDSVDTLVAHCAAGVSRSGAVGVFACRYLGLDESHLRPIVLPNMHVLGLLTEVSGINNDYIKCWDEMLNSPTAKRLERMKKIKFTW
jgi:predicted protein tyrosine phosphatase